MEFGAFGLDVWTVVSAGFWAFVWGDAEFVEDFNKVFGGAFDKAILISVFDAEDEMSVLIAGE